MLYILIAWKIMHVQYNDLIIWPLLCIRTPAPCLMKFAILVGPSMVIYMLNLSDPWFSEDKKRRVIIYIYIYSAFSLYGHDPTQEPLPQGSWNFGKPFSSHHFHILTLSDQCLRVEKKICKEMMHFKHKICMATPLHKNPTKGHEMYKFGGPFHWQI